MYIKEIDIQTFNEYTKNHINSNYTQTLNYAMLMGEYGYDFDLIGFYEDNILKCASLILLKNIKGINYGYAPKGFLIDYKDNNLLKNFTQHLIDFYYEKEVAFIKINPEIIIGNINNKTYINTRNSNTHIINNLTELGYNKLKDNFYFEAMFPRFNAIIDLTEFKSYNLRKNTKNKVKKSSRKGLEASIASINDIKYFNKFLNNNNEFYRDFYNTYSKTNDAEIMLITVDNHKFLQNSQEKYIKENEYNILLNNKMIKASHTKNINHKMNSDLALLSYKKDILEATKLIEDKKELVLAIALIVKNNDKVKVIASSFNKNYKRYNANYFLYYSIIKHYSKTHTELDLNGISGDLSKKSPFKGLNDFKLGFNPKLYEYIGEFDLVIEPKAYKYLLKQNLLGKEFQKKY